MLNISSDCDVVSLAAPGVRQLQPYLPGKPISELEREYGISDIIKLASNENPLGVSPKALQAMRDVGVTPPFTISLAKREEEVFVPGEAEPRRLSKHSYGLRLLQYVRDESHRFAQHYHHMLRRKSTFGE